jgi:phage major head subunit gpT-like protein
LRTSRTPQFTDRSANVALFATFAPSGGAWTTLDCCRSMRPATEQSFSGAKCA